MEGGQPEVWVAAQQAAWGEVPSGAVRQAVLEEVQQAAWEGGPSEAVRQAVLEAVRPAAWEGAPRAADQRVAWGEVQQGDGYCREGIKYSRAMPDDIVQMIVQAYFWYPFTNDTI